MDNCTCQNREGGLINSEAAAVIVQSDVSSREGDVSSFWPLTMGLEEEPEVPCRQRVMYTLNLGCSRTGSYTQYCAVCVRSAQ